MKIRVMIVDDHKMFREGLRALISGEPDMEVVGEAADGGEAVALAREIAPDVVIMDMRMPVMNGIDATRNLVEERPETRVLVLSMYPSDQLHQSIAEAGASGYVLKGCDFVELAAAIRCACGGSQPSPAKPC
jgi:DNA-binding NarL/FixJ family response regulator